MHGGEGRVAVETTSKFRQKTRRAIESTAGGGAVPTRAVTHAKLSTLRVDAFGRDKSSDPVIDFRSNTAFTLALISDPAWRYSSTSCVLALLRPSHITKTSPTGSRLLYVRPEHLTTTQTNDQYRPHPPTFHTSSSTVPAVPARKLVFSPPSEPSTAPEPKESRSMPVSFRPLHPAN